MPARNNLPDTGQYTDFAIKYLLLPGGGYPVLIAGYQSWNMEKSIKKTNNKLTTTRPIKFNSKNLKKVFDQPCP
jgi:hypothetical protein